ncbi:peptide chain release factor N(5)-glutamine methyltransferase [Prevotella sp.]|jgi:release factor glutamine methyltransferase|uniref:peptide chain release factor N(5)-glutamine methyltransferase n=1 Tax=Prevotella sp. TaxID=59823 RepID=UPI0025F6613F|nr:peptide chain release factor N(5)-glutamine methyltransferase [Prevotella sp.]MCI6130711.1 peptide chain release factor N(5)-glutamine methyltransferase [Prevotella sp.]MCI7372106.1 peptide chain release factor N(5)-glutamine methyltransferase [Prevotella sp.]
MTYDDIWRRLAGVYDQREARAVARMLVEEKFSLSFADIICGGVEALPDADKQWIEAAVKRLEQGEPIQYVLGWAWFGGLKFNVRSGVLIPRPETEWLVDNICAHPAPSNDRPLRILDIGTGSGCIALSIKQRLPETYVEAWDISTEALSIAADNARSLSLDVVWRQQDALNITPNVLSTTPNDNSVVPDSPLWDVIVSNPPYICERERTDMARNVLEHEPSTALFVPDTDPLLFYRAITRYAVGSLNEGGRLLFECNTLYAGDTARMMADEGMTATQVYDDCFGKPRFAVGKRK